MVYPCPLAEADRCQHGGNKDYDYGFTSGMGSYCRLVKKWVCDLKECPMKKEG